MLVLYLVISIRYCIHISEREMSGVKSKGVRVVENAQKKGEREVKTDSCNLRKEKER